MQMSSAGSGFRHEPAPEQQHHQDDAADPAYLQAQAMRCRRLARSIGDTETVEKLARMADEFEAKIGDAR